MIPAEAVEAAESRVAKSLFELSEVSIRPWDEYVYGSPNTREHWMRMARIVIKAYKGVPS